VSSWVSVCSAWDFGMLWDHKRLPLHTKHRHLGMHLTQPHSCPELITVHNHHNLLPTISQMGARGVGDLKAVEVVGSDLFIFKQRPVRQHPASAGCQGYGGLISTTLQS